jgi:hypothetical protein
MKKLARKLERIFSAATFAEAGEYETAKEILREGERSQKTDRVTPAARLGKLERIFSAATFAEAGEYETAKEILREGERSQKTDRVTPAARPRKELRAPGIKR